MGFHKMLNEFLIRRLNEPSFFSEVRGQVAVGLGDGIESGLGKVAQNGSAAPE